jgi:hydroxymethylbilane synthase
VQTALVEQFPDYTVEPVVIKTRGDTIRDLPLSKIGDKGLFIREIEAALLEYSVDIAVHSLKDMPSELPQGLLIAGVLPRSDPRDVIVSFDRYGFDSLPAGSVVGTSSLRRRALILHERPDLIVRDVRGNVDTRIRKCREGDYDALVLAAAGLLRSGNEEVIAEYLDPGRFVPSGCQGIIGLEIRGEDTVTPRLVEAISHGPTFTVATAERRFLQTIQGGCKTPVGCFVTCKKGRCTVTGMVADPEGKTVLKRRREGSAGDASSVAEAVAEEIISAGGREILEAIDHEN